LVQRELFYALGLVEVESIQTPLNGARLSLTRILKFGALVVGLSGRLSR
jgi:hypothetical protein